MQFSVVVKGEKIFVGVAMQKFSALFLDKKRVEKIKAICEGVRVKYLRKQKFSAQFLDKTRVEK